MITITGNVNQLYNTTYRPILISAADSSNDTAFLRAELHIEDGWLSNTFVSTGIIMNGYEKSTQNNIYEFNLMEYCRNFVSPGICPIMSDTGWNAPGFIETAKFKLNIWAVKYSQTTMGGLYDDFSQTVWTKEWIGVGLNTSEEDSTTLSSGFTMMDSYVLGQNSWLPDGDEALALTDKPQIDYQNLTTSVIHDHGFPGFDFMVNRDDYPEASLYVPVITSDLYDKVSLVIIVLPLSGPPTFANIHIIPLTNHTMLYRLPMHPETLEQLYVTNMGATLGQIINGSNQLIARGVCMQLWLHDASYSNIKDLQHYGYDQSLSQYSVNASQYAVEFSDKKNNGKCTRTKFVFKNARGGFDFFNCYGTQNKEVSVGGTDFDHQVTDKLRGIHGRKNLWTTREDNYSVISQPINNRHATWLQQLIVSPQVWVQMERRYVESANRGEKFNYLHPIIIDKGSYKVYNTDDNVNYVEFKYHLSNPKTTQIG